MRCECVGQPFGPLQLKACMQSVCGAPALGPAADGVRVMSARGAMSGPPRQCLCLLWSMLEWLWDTSFGSAGMRGLFACQSHGRSWLRGL